MIFTDCEPDYAQKNGVLMSERRVHGGGCRADQDQVKVKRQQVSPPMMVEVRFMVRRLL